MSGRETAADAIDDELRHWRQGDVSLDCGLEFVHVADLSRPHSPVSVAAAGGGDGERRMTDICARFEKSGSVPSHRGITTR